MATGSRPFDGETPTATMAKILEAEVTPPSEVVAELPTELDRIIRRCLQKNPADRYNDSRDLLIDLKALHDAVSSGVVSRILWRLTVQDTAEKAGTSTTTQLTTGTQEDSGPAMPWRLARCRTLAHTTAGLMRRA